MDGLDYGAPEPEGAQAAVPVPPGSRYYLLPESDRRGPASGTSDASDALVDAAQLAPASPEEDLTPVPDQPDAAVAQSVGLERVRLNALHVFGAPVTQLSTSRLFAWLVECGASPLAIEWVNDFSCNVVFHDAPAALHGLQHLMLAPTAEERARTEEAAQREQEENFAFGAPDPDAEPALIELPDDLITGIALPKSDEVDALLRHLQRRTETQAATETQPSEETLPDADAQPAEEEEQDLSQFNDLAVSLLTSRKLRPVPLKIYTPKEREQARRLLQHRQKQLRASKSAEGEDMAMDDTDDAQRETHLPPAPPTLPRKPTFNTDDMAKLTSTLYARFSVAELDQKQRGARAQSDWYRNHGLDAGREVVPLLNIGEKAKKAQLKERELLDLPILEQRMRSDKVRDRSLSPGREGVDRIQIRGRGTIRAPDEPRRGRGRHARGRGQTQDEGLLESDKIELAQRSDRPDADAVELFPSAPSPAAKLTDRLASSTPLEARIAGPSLLDRLGTAPTPSSGSGGRRRNRW